MPFQWKLVRGRDGPGRDPDGELPDLKATGSSMARKPARSRSRLRMGLRLLPPARSDLCSSGGVGRGLTAGRGGNGGCGGARGWEVTAEAAGAVAAMKEKMRRSIGLLLCVSAMMASAEARFLSFNWDVKQELDPNKMKVVTINGATPGPDIRAQQGDTIVVKVTNNLEEELAIRWWKIKQIGTQPCQGTNGFISARGTCAYRLVADQPGKFSYQSKFKMQGDAGLSGSIVVLPRFKKNP